MFVCLLDCISGFHYVYVEDVPMKCIQTKLPSCMFLRETKLTQTSLCTMFQKDLANNLKKFFDTLTTDLLDAKFFKFGSRIRKL